MPNVGNAWHVPRSPEPRGRAGMRVPVGSVVPGTALRIVTGNQFQGGGNAGNQSQVGSSILFRKATEQRWAELPLTFEVAAGNNKYYSAVIPEGTFDTGDQVEYYCRIAYDDRETTFIHGTDDTSATTVDEAVANSAPFHFTIEDSASKGLWGPVFPLRNVAAHAAVLPTGRVLIWGRRDRPDESLDVHECTPFLWDPATQEQVETPQPRMTDGTKVNLFCAGHAFLPDGRLLVVGGHRADSDGLDQAVLYDAARNTWTPTKRMNNGRWYPTATALPEGGVLVLSGSYIQGGRILNNSETQVWTDGNWKTLHRIPVEEALDLYPRLHLTSNGIAFMSGPRVQTWKLDVSDGGRWSTVAPHLNGQRDYAPSVMLDGDRVIYIGGGNDATTHEPAAATETIDLSEARPQWRRTEPMRFRRRQHNATILADGTVLVTGGTRGGGGMEPNSRGFNDLRPGQPVHVAELWDPMTSLWSELAAEQVDRCYHATAVLLPDATVLSAGGGEYRPFDDLQNDPEDSHRDAQVFFPPYLYWGLRPEVTAAPATVRYGDTFQVGTPQAERIAKVTWIGLSSVTHSFNMGQRINVLPFETGPGRLEVSAPGSPNLCPPGHYMLFILSDEGVPSVAKIVRIGTPPGTGAVASEAEQPHFLVAASQAPPDYAYVDAFARRAAMVEAAKGRPVVVGITGTCPYGIGSCWGGASEALRTLEGVQYVDPIPDADDSTANIFLEDERLPPLHGWDEQFRRMVNGSYDLRGVEVTLDGAITTLDGRLFLERQEPRPPVELSPLGAGDKVQWDRSTGGPRPPQPEEASAYERLAAEAEAIRGGRPVTVTGPLEERDVWYRLKVRLYSFSL